MSSSGLGLETSMIPLKDINLATKDFSAETRIGDGGFGLVHRGELFDQHGQKRIVAIKRLDLKGHQGKNEFLTELTLISNFHHENIIQFVGYCDEGEEMIIVYEYASNGSLDHHLQDLHKRRCLTWAQRLKICLGAARGLYYLHSDLWKKNIVIHRDVKSGNILLDENLNAKICDFGLSKENLIDQRQTQVYTKVAGTNFYLDPIYHESGILRKDSDVYSFGVVLFEMLSGMLAWQTRSLGDGKPQTLINLVRRYWKYGLEKLIDPFIRDQIDTSCYHAFKDLAYQCISYDSENRPAMDVIIRRIEEAMNFQEGNNDPRSSGFSTSDDSNGFTQPTPAYLPHDDGRPVSIGDIRHRMTLTVSHNLLPLTYHIQHGPPSFTNIQLNNNRPPSHTEFKRKYSF